MPRPATASIWWRGITGKALRLDTHMHREAQLVYAAKGTMQVTTPKGRWLVPPDRAVWVPARLEHSIDVLADIQMRDAVFRSGVAGAGAPQPESRRRIVVRVSRLLHESILALFDGRDDPGRTDLSTRLAMPSCIRPKTPPPSFRRRTSGDAAAQPISCWPIRPK